MTIASVNLHNAQRTKVVSAGIKLLVMNQIPYWLNHFIYVPLFSLWDDYRHRNNPPLPPDPCQICGKLGHKTISCPNASKLDY